MSPSSDRKRHHQEHIPSGAATGAVHLVAEELKYPLVTGSTTNDPLTQRRGNAFQSSAAPLSRERLMIA
jgi:ABC-type Co2+ transport system permease subunit